MISSYAGDSVNIDTSMEDVNEDEDWQNVKFYLTQPKSKLSTLNDIFLFDNCQNIADTKNEKLGLGNAADILDHHQTLWNKLPVKSLDMNRQANSISQYSGNNKSEKHSDNCHGNEYHSTNITNDAHKNNAHDLNCELEDEDEDEDAVFYRQRQRHHMKGGDGIKSLQILQYNTITQACEVRGESLTQTETDPPFCGQQSLSSPCKVEDGAGMGMGMRSTSASASTGLGGGAWADKKSNEGVKASLAFSLPATSSSPSDNHSNFSSLNNNRNISNNNKPSNTVDHVITRHKKRVKTCIIENYEFDCKHIFVTLGDVLEFRVHAQTPRHVEHFLEGRSMIVELCFSSGVLQVSGIRLRSDCIYSAKCCLTIMCVWIDAT